MDIYNQVIDVCKGKEGEILTSSQIKDMVSNKFGTDRSSILPSDYCYNRYNEGISFNKHLFVMINRNEYKFVGEGYPYSGRVYWKPKGGKTELIVGEWRNGKYHVFEDLTKPIGKTPNKDKSKEDIEPGIEKLNKEQIQNLYEEYMGILELEVNVFGLKPTEVRHLIGRIGEFKCALITNGSLTHEVNQHGFDVIAEDKKVSVKTTAQKSGFVSINKNTLGKADDLMILQYDRNEFKVIYYGGIETAIEQARTSNELNFIDALLPLSNYLKLQTLLSIVALDQVRFS